MACRHIGNPFRKLRHIIEYGERGAFVDQCDAACTPLPQLADRVEGRSIVVVYGGSDDDGAAETNSLQHALEIAGSRWGRRVIPMRRHREFVSVSDDVHVAVAGAGGYVEIDGSLGNKCRRRSSGRQGCACCQYPEPDQRPAAGERLGYTVTERGTRSERVRNGRFLTIDLLTMTDRPHGGLGAVAHADLAQKALDVNFHRRLRDIQLAGNVLIGSALREMPQDGVFPTG